MNTGKFLYLVKQNVIVWLALIAVVLSKPVLSANLDIAQTPLAVKRFGLAARYVGDVSRSSTLHQSLYRLLGP